MTLQEIPAVGTPEWVEARRTFIGASDAPAVLGLSPWATPLDVWADKLDIGTRFEGNLATRMGHALEAMIAQEWLNENPGHVLFDAPTVRHPDLPHIAVSVDKCVDKPVELQPDDLLEIKMVGANVTYAWRDGPPLYVRVQAHTQMAVTGAQRVHICALFLDRGYEYRSWALERDEEAIASILVRLDQFWRDYVETGERPDISDTWRADKTAKALERIYADAEPGKAVRLPTEALETIAELKRTKALAKDLKEQIAALENDLKATLGDATDGFIDDNAKPAVTWRPQARTTYDTKAVLAGKVDGFSADELDVARRVLLAVQTITPSRVLRVAA